MSTSTLTYQRNSSRAWRFNSSFATLALWACLWSNLNTGDWNIQAPSSFDEWQLMIRAVLPYGVLPFAIFLILRRGAPRLPGISPSRFLLIYGLVATAATVFSPVPAWSIYWSINFCATVLLSWAFIERRRPVLSARLLLQLTWVASFVVAVMIAYQARNSIFGSTASAYQSVESELGGLSRSSGVARWAAVPGLVCVIRVFYTRRWVWIGFFLSISAVSFFIVYRMQSRGAIFGSVGSLFFILILSERIRRYVLPSVVIAIVLTLLWVKPESLSNRVAAYIERGQTREELLSMTGRTRAYENGLLAFYDAPVFGRGQWTDRMVIGEHVHNSYLQALLNGGIVGGLPYLASWISGWVLFLRVRRRQHRLDRADRICSLEAGAVMMFFSIRAIPETTTASFSVDLLVMIAVYVYLEVLVISTERQQKSYGLTSRFSSLRTAGETRTPLGYGCSAAESPEYSEEITPPPSMPVC